ncbi:NAD-dependent succinate-semialdehyde dehydrogenase [Leptospira langatensis]|uniref:NAD-dependent succinate-semialdehyde dehydrogenase n=1 Tax=Leptospira langatensis TaxID=2484983 RepID=A0A5F1ZU60_9LEPT|nr:NAD-dependent succinate-semialdehyde dehydrogenase [Leptospira langatensis]TGK01566.1 NAD-dependent succinate-semialdehyde dehydrogenase [Leptospira langatensis]TGL41984.1 NAD-dependent succinate-semialdehyde dehydrogenase [Leptospira langatensis]
MNPLNLAQASLFRNSNFYSGQWKDFSNTISVQDPSNGKEIGAIPDLTAEEVRSAIQFAEKAQKTWSKTLPKERAKYLRNWANLMLQNREDLAKIMTLEQGKPLSESRGEIDYAASYLEWFAEEAKRTYGDIIPTHRKELRLLSWKEPIGVTGILTPWNFPSSMITRKVGPALAAGCVVISKPSELTPYSAIALAVLAQEAGLPPGVFQVVTGRPEVIADEFLDNPSVKKISFTGSTRVGKILLERSAKQIKRISLELGGNAPFIVFADANLQEAVKGAIASKFRNTGQTCVCANRFLVEEKIADEFASKLSEEVSKFKVGNGFEEGVNQGPLIHSASLHKVDSHVKDALQKGGRLWVGGKSHSLGGNFYEPTVISNVSETSICFQEETFGPLAPIRSFKTEEEALQIANATSVGLASYLYTNEPARIWRMTESIEAGMVAVNEGILSTEQVPFGGVKESGIGREGSKYGIEAYQEIKYICWGGQV